MNSADRILIIDDEEDIGIVLSVHLKDVGFPSAWAGDGMKGLELLSRENFSLVLLDMKMPGLSGMEVLKRIKEQWETMPVIMMTAHGSEDIAVEAMKKGAADYIPKPFRSDMMVKTVERVLQLSKKEQENLRLRRQVEEERRKMEAILKGMADLVIAVDEKGGIITLNKRAAELFGVHADEAVGMPVERVLKADIPPERLPCREVLSGPQPEPRLGVSYNLLIGKESIPVLSSATPLVDGEGKIFGSVEIIRDISVLKALELEREDFVSMLSHDLKSPITAVVGSIDLVREGRLGPVNDEQVEYLESAIESCNEMVEMIDNLLDVHKFEAGKMLLFFKEEEPWLLVKRHLEKMRPLAEKAGITLKSAVSADLPPLAADRSKVVRLLGNLLSNALKFTPEGGEIEVRLDTCDIGELRSRIPSVLYPPQQVPEKGRYLRLSVRDSGSGIPASDVVMIFDRYVQARNRRSGLSGGSGLGLAFCRKVMDAHVGFIWGETAPEGGSLFTALFPLERNGHGES